jgi:hypothetical protein
MKHIRHTLFPNDLRFLRLLNERDFDAVEEVIGQTQQNHCVVCTFS